VSQTPWTEALLAAALFAVDPATGGVAVRAAPGPVRDRFLAALRSFWPASAPVRRIPLHVGDDRLLGGLDLAATLQAGAPIAARGLLAEADGGMVLLAMAERVSAGVSARVGAALDSGMVTAERDGLALCSSAEFGVVALDEGIGEDERPSPGLLDRLAFQVDLSAFGLQDTAPPGHDLPEILAARALLPAVEMPDDMLETLCGTAGALGVRSMRALLLAVRAARAAAALAGRRTVTEADATAAARLVFAPRATQLPAPPAETPQDSADTAPPPENPGADPSGETDDGAQEDRPVGDIMLEAAKAAMPAGLIERLLAGKADRTRAQSGGGAGAMQQSLRRGRPVGVRRGALRSGARLNLLATLRAAAPWQPLRRRAQSNPAHHRVLVEPDDFRITRFRQRTETTTIFLVDASGSAALNRLAEAKGAVELVLADCYVRRDRVALIAFRGAVAELLLPPTSSLVRAKRALAGLPGGGATPLATGIDSAFALADTVRRKGQSPVLVLLSDGRANMARDGSPGRIRAEEDALAAGRMVRGAAMTCVLVDTSPRPAQQARRLAAEMGALYLPLPYADAHALSRAVQASAHA
jgi:magnesium chelatase subunit D